MRALALGAALSALTTGSCVPDARLDPCGVCEGACEARRCVPVEIGSFQGEVRYLAASADDVYACVELPTGARLERLSFGGSASVVLAELGPLCSGLVVREDEGALYVGSWDGALSVEGAGPAGIGRMALPTGALVLLTRRSSLGTFDVRNGVFIAGDYHAKALVRSAPAGALETVHFLANPGWEGEVRLDASGRVLLTDGLDGSVVRYTPDGAMEPLFNGEASSPASLHLHAVGLTETSVVAAFRDRVVAIDAATRAPTVLATGLADPVRLVAEGDVVFAVLEAEGRILRLGLHPSAEPFVAARGQITAATVAGGYLYFAEATGAVSRVPFE